jgi:type II secretory ATPase GspE/PulE/Tfp pilus assembly ATPase PilB-like protein
MRSRGSGSVAAATTVSTQANNGPVPLPDSALAAPALLEALIHRAETAGASDIHLHALGDRTQIAFRLDGVLSPISELPPDVAERVFGRIKFLARLKTYQESLPQDGRIDRADVKARHDLRVATYPTVTGEKIVLRLFQISAIVGLAELGLPEQAWAELENVLRQPAGLLLLTGPAGSGKTTTIYACLRHLAGTGGRHIITVEDPVEQIVPGVMQTEINEARGLDFSKAARHLLRQDPQVLVIGEVRDEETAHIAVRAALTGHLVIATLHAGSCRGVFERLLVMTRETSAVAAAVELVLNQRLLRRVCAACHGAGCETCLRTGYRGRAALVEWVRCTDAIRARLRQQDFNSIHPVLTFADQVRSLIAAGGTDAAEQRRILGT